MPDRYFEATYQVLFEENPSPMWAFDRDTLAILAINEAAVRQYGYSREEFLTMTVDKIHPSSEISGLIEKCARPGEDCKMEPVHAGIYRHRKKDGTMMDADLICYPIPFNGRHAIFLLVNDVLTRHRRTT